jgi:hypothetical protein
MNITIAPHSKIHNVLMENMLWAIRSYNSAWLFCAGLSSPTGPAEGVIQDPELAPTGSGQSGLSGVGLTPVM